MPSGRKPRAFISYARKDGEEFARGLRERLDGFSLIVCLGGAKTGRYRTVDPLPPLPSRERVG